MVFFDSIIHVYHSLCAPFRKTLFVVDIASQVGFLYCHGFLQEKFPVSTSSRGVGELSDSFKTPRGWFTVCDLIGAEEPLDRVFMARKPNGSWSGTKIDQPVDPILARIIRLEGVQTRNSNTFARFIYIHGSPCVEMDKNKPLSHGCVRMYCQDVVSLFDRLSKSSIVYMVDANNQLPYQPCFMTTR